MARGGRVIYKKAATGKSRKARSKHDGDDDRDEEYVLEEDEDEESESNFESDVNSRDLSDEESFEFCEFDRSDDEEEEKKIKIAKSKKKRGNREKSRVSDDEMEADYELDDEEEEKVVEIARSKKKRRNLKKSRFSDDEMDSDYELNDDDEEKEFKITKSKKKQVNRKKSRVSDDEMESGYGLGDEKEENELKIAKSKKKQGNRKKPRISVDEMDSDYEFDGRNKEKEVKIARLEMKRRNLKKCRLSDDEMDSDYELDDEDEEKEVKTGRSKKKFMVSDDEMDSNYELDDEEEDKAFEIERSKKRQGDRNKNSFFYDEMEDLLIPKRRGRGRPGKKETWDSDYELDGEDEEKQFKSARSKGNSKKSRVSDDEDEEKELTIARSKKSRGNCKTSRVSNAKMEDISVPKRRGKGRTRKQSYRDSDYELDDEDDDDEDFSPDEDDFDEDEISIASKQTKKVSKTKGRKKNKRNGMIRSSDDEFVVKNRVSVGRKGKRNKSVRKRGSEADLVSLDLVVTSGDDFVEKDIVRINNRGKNNKKVTKGAGLKGGRKKRSVEGSESSDSDFVISDDDDVVNVKDQVVLDKQELDRKKEKVGESNRRKRRKRSTVDLESSDFDYLISEDDEDFIVAEDHAVIDRQQKKSKKARKKRSRSSVDSDSDSFDFDDSISEEEVRNLRIGGGLNSEKPKRVITGKKVEEKGKQKQADDLGKQVCGICLSEEKKSVVQGLLNCCTHYFCFACIMEWSKVESRCPLCKRRFATISKLGKSNPGVGMRSSVIRVKKCDQVYQPSEEELWGILDPYENVVCMECEQGGDDNLMLLCDTCDSSAHTYCVGLGREVPEGNWYCECCRSVSDGMLNQETSNSNFFSSITERSGFSNMHANINSPRPSSLRIDLNALPRDFPGEDTFLSTPSGYGASTVSGRRHIRHRIHVILSNNRQRQTDAEVTMLASMNLNPLPSVTSFEHRQQNVRSFFPSHTNLAPCMLNEGSSFRHVDRAKEEVQHLVKCHLKNLSQNRILHRSIFKEIAQKSTHTILAACGIEHRRNMVSTAIEPPENCVHDSNDGPSHLLKGCCSSCFESFVKDVVQQKIIDIDTTA